MVKIQQKKDIIKKYKKWGKLRNFYNIDNVPVGVATKLMTGWPNVDPTSAQNLSPTMKEMVRIAKQYNGKLHGYVVPVESGRDDARISFEGFYIKADPRTAKKISNDTRPDEFDEIKTNYWRFWWD